LGAVLAWSPRTRPGRNRRRFAPDDALGPRRAGIGGAIAWVWLPGATAGLDEAAAPGAPGVAGNLTFLRVGDVLYLSVDSFKNLIRGKASLLPAGKRWLKIDLKTLGAGGAGSLNQANPASVLDFLRGVSAVRNLGSATVRGAATTHYEITIDLAKAVQKAPASQRAQVQQAAIAIGGSRTIPAGVWIDARGRIRRFSSTVDVRQSSGTAHVIGTFEYSNFGTRVSVTAPPAGEVLDFSQFLGQLGSSLGGANV
jgi:hypothetical protein